MRAAAVTYLTVDAVADGVGLSQVVPYAGLLARRGLDVRLHSYEKGPSDEALAVRLSAAGVHWSPHRFRPGTAAGAGRVLHGAALVARADLVHARSDIAAAACMVGRPRRWVWDMRGFWREQRIALGMLREGSAQDRIMGAIEDRAARTSDAVVTLSQAAVDVLRARYGEEVAAKASVITTCVDLDRFPMAPLPPPEPLRFLLAGSLNRLYDVPAMLELVRAVRARRQAHLTVLASEPSPWTDDLRAAGADPGSAPAAAMPGHVHAAHVGLSVLRAVGVSNAGAMPTKLGEFLAAGRPVVVSPGLGDMDQFLSSYDCGVVLADVSAAGLRAAADEVERLVADPETPGRCRALAEEHFSLERGVDRLLTAYEGAVSR